MKLDVHEFGFRLQFNVTTSEWTFQNPGGGWARAQKPQRNCTFMNWLLLSFSPRPSIVNFAKSWVRFLSQLYCFTSSKSLKPCTNDSDNDNDSYALLYPPSPPLVRHCPHLSFPISNIDRNNYLIPPYILSPFLSGDNFRSLQWISKKRNRICLVQLEWIFW